MTLLRPPSNNADVKLRRKWILSWMIGPIALVALTGSSRSQSLLEVSLTYLQRHGVPCKSVVKIDSTDTLDEVAICQDGREWVMFWLEDEVAFVRPGSRQLYRWRVDVNKSFPDLYKDPQQISKIQFLGSNGP
jgi:hypothetical protein